MDENILLLHLLSKDKESNKIESNLNKKQQIVLIQILKNIKIFEGTQENEIKPKTDFKAKENIYFRTAMPIWNDLMDLLKKYPEILKPEYQSKISKIIEGHPLIVTRLILSPEGLNYFHSEIFRIFEEKIKRWLNCNL